MSSSSRPATACSTGGWAPATLLHQGEHVVRAQAHLHRFIRDLLTEGARTGALRDDVAPEELASYCLHALVAAGNLPSKSAVRRLVTVTLAGLSPPGPHATG